MQIITLSVSKAARNLNTTPEVVTQWLWEEFNSNLVVEFAEETKIEEIDAANPCGIVNRSEFYGHTVDNKRFDAGFWGGSPLVRSHCGAKCKRTMLRKRGRV